MNPHDDATLQARAERPPRPEEDVLTTEERAELAAYRVLYAALREEPDFALPPSFAEGLARRVFPAREPLWEWLAPAALLLTGGAALVAIPPARGSLRAALPAVTSLLDAAPLPLLAAAGLAVGVVLLADRLIAPAIGSPAR